MSELLAYMKLWADKSGFKLPCTAQSAACVQGPQLGEDPVTPFPVTNQTASGLNAPAPSVSTASGFLSMGNTPTSPRGAAVSADGLAQTRGPVTPHLAAGFLIGSANAPLRRDHVTPSLYPGLHYERSVGCQPQSTPLHTRSGVTHSGMVSTASAVGREPAPPFSRRSASSLFPPAQSGRNLPGVYGPSGLPASLVGPSYLTPGAAAPIPAALGAPPGEESFGRENHPPQAGLVFSSSDESSGDSESDRDQSPSGSHGTRARALLLEYMPEVFQPFEVHNTRASRLFPGGRPPVGIPLSDDFKQAYSDVATASSDFRASKKAKLFARDFVFQSADMKSYFEAKAFSSDFGHVGTRLGVNFASRTYAAGERLTRDLEG